jgi:hypothetical protein
MIELAEVSSLLWTSTSITERGGTGMDWIVAVLVVVGGIFESKDCGQRSGCVVCIIGGSGYSKKSRIDNPSLGIKCGEILGGIAGVRVSDIRLVKMHLSQAVLKCGKLYFPFAHANHIEGNTMFLCSIYSRPTLPGNLVVFQDYYRNFFPVTDDVDIYRNQNFGRHVTRHMAYRIE